jgi:hypothetical protein
VGSKTFDGVWFAAYTQDHLPPHVHGFYAGVEVIVDLLDGETALSQRKKAVKPGNAKQADVSRILRTATKYADELMELWRQARG